VAHLQQEGIDDIEVVILSHGDSDHVGGLIDVLRSSIPVDAVLYNSQHSASLTYQQFLTETMKRGLTPTPAQVGQSHTWGPVNASVLNPQNPPTGEQNEDSVVILAVYGDVRFLFPGDVGTDTYQAQADFVVFLPLVAKPASSEPTYTPTYSSRPPGTTPSPYPDSRSIVITSVFHDGVQDPAEPDEYVEIRNDDTVAIRLYGWTLHDEANYVFTFPDHVMEPGHVCRVYTNAYYSESCAFSYGSSAAIWDNGGDCAYLQDSAGTLIDTYCY